MRAFVLALPAVLVIVGCNPPNSSSSTAAPDQRASSGDNAVSGDNVASSPDNTAVNRRDVDQNTKTPIDQNENQADIDLVAKIRRQVLEVKDLSTNARNVKIMVVNGKVTLRGPVNSTEERDTIERIARDAAGDGNVDNQIDVKAQN